MQNFTSRHSNAPRNYARNQDGHFSTIFAIMSAVIVSGMACAVDIGNVMKDRSRLQDVADAVALSAARDGLLTQGEMDDFAQAYLNHAYENSSNNQVSLHSIRKSGDTYTVNLNSQTKTSFAKFMGKTTLEANVSSTATFAKRNLDISLVLDNTGSMKGSKLAALKAASNDLVDILFDDAESVRRTQLGLVPFASWVNVGTNQAGTSWLDTSGRSPQNRTYFDAPVSRFQLYAGLGKQWDGCVENRLPPYDIDDTAPDPAKPETLYQPAFHPDMADTNSRGYNYVADNRGGNEVDRLRYTAKYAGPLAGNVAGPTKRADDSCDSNRKVTPLTNNVATIKRGIRNMKASGWTNIANGAVWGFRLISPNAPFTQGRSYDDPNTTKAMVILTDGMQTMGGHAGSFNSGYSPFGFMGEPTVQGKTRLSGSNVKQALDRKLAQVCEAAKKKDIVIYTITFELNDNSTQDMMRACATDPGKYFNAARAAELSPVFKEIAASLGDLRISN